MLNFQSIVCASKISIFTLLTTQEQSKQRTLETKEMGKILIKFKVMHSLSFVLFAKRMAEAF